MPLISSTSCLSGQRGATLVEYSLLVAFIALTSVGALQYFSTSVDDEIVGIERDMSVAAGGFCDKSNPDYPNCNNGFGF